MPIPSIPANTIAINIGHSVTGATAGLEYSGGRLSKISKNIKLSASIKKKLAIAEKGTKYLITRTIPIGYSMSNKPVVNTRTSVSKPVYLSTTCKKKKN